MRKQRSSQFAFLVAVICWVVVLVVYCGSSFAQTGPYAFPLKWVRVPDVPAAAFYQIGAGTNEGVYTIFKDVSVDWDTATLEVPELGPWYIAVRTCLPRPNASPVCSADWRRARNAPGSMDYGPFYPKAYTDTLETPADLWLNFSEDD